MASIGIVVKKKGPSPLKLVELAAEQHPEIFDFGLKKLYSLEIEAVYSIIESIPDDWITSIARDFAISFIEYSFNELKKLR